MKTFEKLSSFFALTLFYHQIINLHLLAHCTPLSPDLNVEAATDSDKLSVPANYFTQTDNNGTQRATKAYQILLNNTNHLHLLQFIKRIPQIISLKDSVGIGQEALVIVTPDDQSLFERFLEKHKLNYTIASENVEKLIEEEAAENAWKRKLMADDTGMLSYFDITRYHSYNDMVAYMRHLEWKYYYMVKMIDLGVTYEGRTIKTLKIGNPIHDTNKRAIWIDAGIHAREWASHSTAMYFINLLTENYDRDPLIKQYVNNFTWYITPVLNPDGYEFTRSSTKIGIRFWRKNRARSERFCVRGRCCVGVDLNRNFDFYWNAWGNSRHPCTEDYRGTAPFSENETLAVQQFLYRHSNEIDAYITLHTYSQYWIFPYGHRAAVYPSDVNELKAVAINATQALKNVYGTEYRVGSGADLLYSASGGSEDWAKAKMNIKFSYLLELRPKENDMRGFVVRPKFIRPIGEETWEGIKVVADAVWKMNHQLKKYAKDYNGPRTIYSILPVRHRKIIR